ncbi:Nitrogenase (molybdenum-iron) reductase and maturation protein NifH [Methanosarcina lacustris Z-7289]|uniref:Nitrogenase (Molybdenum-iron) reductase and maturation protein NifH n=1 Tax=Methanosarcina lacustris Z-7289 TaxID=1434111 RepID=A0A0E3S832_9EURY|nr:nitrogenase component 1 [Methanosarcina lacustris]AKB75647.1 Nitrogenase (molybdenum-iron) reductase and maturation protein NifH [Methanosarcina lacustris Z-7289]
MQIAFYGKGGIGKSTVSANLSAALVESGKRILQVGCDPKSDSTRLLLGGRKIPTVLDYLRKTSPDKQSLEGLLFRGFKGAACVETGGPKPGVGCAGRGILSSFEALARLGIRDVPLDIVLYDVLGDVVCGGFAVPLRSEYADAVFLVTSGEFMAIYAANNILRGIKNFEDSAPRVAGIILNSRGLEAEDQRISAFSKAVGLPVVASIPRSEIFSRAEKAGKTLIEAFPESENAEIFRELARHVEKIVKDRSLLYHARPLEDGELEELVLGRSPEDSASIFMQGELEKEVGCESGFEEEAGCEGGFEEETGHEDGAINEPEEYLCETWGDCKGKACKGEAGDASSSGNLSCSDSPRVKPASGKEKVPVSGPSGSGPVMLKAPLYGCAFAGAVTATFQVNGALTVLHGPRSCAHIISDALASSFLRSGSFKKTGVKGFEEQALPGLLSVDMEEEDIIFGGLEKLSCRMEEALASGRKLLFVVSTCPSGIIGDDIEKAVLKMKRLYPEARIFPIPVDGNITGDFSYGFFEGCKKVAELINPEVGPEEGLVNIIGERNFSPRDEENFRIIEKLLEGLGLRVNCRFLSRADLSSIRDFKKARLNLLAYNSLENRMLRDYLSENLGLDFFEHPFPVGFRDSSQWVKALAKSLTPEHDPGPFLEAREQIYRAELRKYSPYLEGKKVLVVSYSQDIGWVLDTVRDLGMELVKVGIRASSFGKDKQLDPLPDDIPLVKNYTDLQRAEDIKCLKPDLVLSGYAPLIPEEDVHCDTIPFSPKVGFMSGLELAKRWSTLLRLPVVEGWKCDGGGEE